VEQHVDVPPREPERGGDVFSRTLLEQAHHHDGALRLAQSVPPAP
jgi:hypothetical protein